MKDFSKKIIKNKVFGFTLVEMLVVISIFVIITGIVLTKNRAFNNSIILGTVAYDVALSIRETQTAGISVAESETTAEDFNAIYGIRFKTATPTQYDIGIDGDGNNRIVDGEVIKTFQLNKGFSIAKLCGHATNQGDCTTNASSINIFFFRPNPDAVIYFGMNPLAYAEVHVKSIDGDIRKVSVSSSGQIAVLDP